MFLTLAMSALVAAQCPNGQCPAAPTPHRTIYLQASPVWSIPRPATPVRQFVRPAQPVREYQPITLPFALPTAPAAPPAAR